MTNLFFGFIGQLILPIFILMIPLAIAGENPSAVLRPVFEIVGQLLMVIVSVLSTLVFSLFQVLTTNIQDAATKHTSK